MRIRPWTRGSAIILCVNRFSGSRNDGVSMHRSVTLRDVAEDCDVSIATVSAVVNGATWVSDETRRRVQTAVDQLGYRPNQLARGLKTRRGYAVGVIVSDLTNPFFTEIVRGLSHALRDSSHSLLLCDSDHRFEVGDLNLHMRRL